MSIYGVTTAGYTATSNARQATEAAADDGLSIFGTILDTINPLQHIPIVSNIYRNLTGDTQNGVSNVAGATLYGGPIGGALALASEAFKAVTSDSKSSGSQMALMSEEAQPTGDNGEKITRGTGIATTTKDWLYGKTTAYQAAHNLVDSHQKIAVTTKDWLSA